MKDYRHFVKILKSKYPEFNVSIRRVKLPNTLYGDCSLISKSKKNRKFLIRINNKLTEDVAISFLIHEFAHVLAWDHPGDWHGPYWGKCYSTIYRIYLTDYLKLR